MTSKTRMLRKAVGLLGLTGASPSSCVTAGPGLAQRSLARAARGAGLDVRRPARAGHRHGVLQPGSGPAADPAGGGRSRDVHGHALDAGRRLPWSYTSDPRRPVCGTAVPADGWAVLLQPAPRLLRVPPLPLEADRGDEIDGGGHGDRRRREHHRGDCRLRRRRQGGAGRGGRRRQGTSVRRPSDSDRRRPQPRRELPSTGVRHSQSPR